VMTEETPALFPPATTNKMSSVITQWSHHIPLGQYIVTPIAPAATGPSRGR
jgi:hypothetical protein